MFRRWRERRLYRRLMASEVERIGHVIDEATAHVQRGSRDATEELRQLPGVPHCRRCKGQLRVTRIAYKPPRARKTRWRTAYRCSRCSAEYPIADFRQSEKAGT